MNWKVFVIMSLGGLLGMVLGLYAMNYANQTRLRTMDRDIGVLNLRIQALEKR